MSPKSRGRDSAKKRATASQRPRTTFSAEERAALTPRYTPPLVSTRRRPSWHRRIGWFQVVLGAVLVVLNYAQDFGPILLPGGHSELYFLLGLVIAGTGTWWLGAFDRPQRHPR